jgi:hypothetical protein
MANPHRQRGTGRGTRGAWRKRYSLESEPALPEILAPKEKAKVIPIDAKKPIDADKVHSLPDIANPVERTGVYHTGPTIETALREPSREKSDEEKIADLEKQIKDFKDAEREYVDHIIRVFPDEFRAARAKIEKKGGQANLEAIRKSYISNYVRWGTDRNRWGEKGPLAPEKAALLEKYLELKLPIEAVETEEKKPSNIENKNFGKNMNNFEGKDQGSHPSVKFEEQLRDQAAANQRIIDGRKIAKVSTDERAPELADVPLTPE